MGEAQGGERAERLIHEGLDAYRLSRQLAIDLYKETTAFPLSERFGLVSQIRRAAVSIPANIAEGAARHTKKEFSRFLYAARGSAAELRLLLDIAAATGNLGYERHGELEAILGRVTAMTNGLISRNLHTGSGK
jgi:four helix bundle protein